MYKSEEIVIRIEKLIKEKNITKTELLKQAELSESVLRSMKKSMPKSDNLAKIADILDCTMDELMGRNIKENTTQEKDKEFLRAYKKAPESVQQGIDTILEPYKENQRLSKSKIG